MKVRNLISVAILCMVPLVLANQGLDRPLPVAPDFQMARPSNGLMGKAIYLPTAPADLFSVFNAGGDRLGSLQNNDGGWDWPLDDGNPNNASPLNTIGPIAMGLAKAYLYTEH